MNEEPKIPLGIFGDLNGAFDCVNHCRLLFNFGDVAFK